MAGPAVRRASSTADGGALEEQGATQNQPATAGTALVHDWLTGMRGGEKVLEVVAEALPGAPIYTLFHVPGSVSEAIERHPIRTSFLQRAPGMRRHYRSYLPLYPTAVESFDLQPYDRVISFSHCAAKAIVPAPDAYHVSYCFSPMRYAWDQEHVYFRQPNGIFARVRGLLLTAIRCWDVATVPRVDRFVTTSSFVARRIRRYYDREALVVPPPVEVEFFTPGAARPRDYCLAVAALVPYKRLELAIEACERSGLELRIVGEGPELRRLEGLVEGRTRLLGTVEKEHLRDLYRGALCLVQPGVEDFGIAAVESLSCGTPVVALGRGGVKDIVHNEISGVLYEEMGDATALAAAIDKCCRMRFNELNLRRCAEEFSKQRFLTAFEEILAQQPASEGSQP